MRPIVTVSIAQTDGGEWFYDILIHGKRYLTGERATHGGACRAARCALRSLRKDIARTERALKAKR